MVRAVVFGFLIGSISNLALGVSFRRARIRAHEQSIVNDHLERLHIAANTARSKRSRRRIETKIRMLQDPSYAARWERNYFLVSVALFVLAVGVMLIASVI
jgi:hypothetical protein